MQIWISTLVVIILTEFVWPLLTLPAGGIWSRSYFRYTPGLPHKLLAAQCAEPSLLTCRFQVVLGFMIILTSSVIAIFLPLWEGVRLCSSPADP